MKKVLLLICLCIFGLNSVSYAAAPKPSQKIFLFYKVSDIILQCQNAEEDKIAGRTELEKDLTTHYNKRFIVQGVQRIPEDTILSAADYLAKVKPNQVPFIVEIELKGQGQSSDLYQNAYGAQTTGVAPTVNVNLKEFIVDMTDKKLHGLDYGVKSYGSGTFAVGRSVYAVEKDPRKNTKNAIRASFRDACRFNETINKYADPTAYEQEYNRFTGAFKTFAAVYGKAAENKNAKIEKFKQWCDADETRKSHWIAVSSSHTDFAIAYINELIKMGVYKE